MLWTKTWQPDAVLLLVGGVVMSAFAGSFAAMWLHHAHVTGFQTEDDVGNVLLATLCFHGAAIIAGIVFLKLHDITFREALGLDNGDWKLNILLILTTLAAATPVMFLLKYLSTLALVKMGYPVDDQRAVEMISRVNVPWMRVYLAFFAVVIAPVAEEFFFRGLLYSAAKKVGWPKTGAVVVSLLFAVIHCNAPIFLPLFVLALALTWLYEKTGGLLAPMLAHGLFNGANLVLLFLAENAKS